MNLRDKLKTEYQIDAWELADGNHKIKCPECQPPHNSRDRPLSVTINPDSIVFMCHHCQYAGGVNEKDQPRTPIVEHRTSRLDGFFSGRGISTKTVKDFAIYEEKGWIAFPYNPSRGSAENVKYRSYKKEFRQIKDGKKSLYNYGQVKNAETVVFVEGEMDVLSCAEVGITNVTTLPDGAPPEAKFNPADKRFNVLKTHRLDNAKKIILFLDADGAGKNLRRELLHRYGKEKCWYVNPPEGCKDANEVLIQHGRDKLREIIERARPYPVDGLYQVAHYRTDVLDLYDGNYAKPVTIGYPSLDRIYKVMLGTFHVWTGIPNHGKSTFLDQCLVNLARRNDWRFAMFSPEHSTKMHIRRLAQIVAGKPFDAGFNGRMTKDELKAAMDWVQEHFYFVETREHTPNITKILEIGRWAVEKFGCQGIVIDPYNEVDASRRGSYREDEHIRDFISSCKRFARLHDITFWIVAHPTKLQKDNDGKTPPPTAYDIAGAAHWHNQSDAVVTVHRDFDNDTISVITRKIREQGLYGQIGEVKFAYDHASRLFVEPPDRQELRSVYHND